MAINVLTGLSSGLIVLDIFSAVKLVESEVTKGI
jgi:hypothetical protein